MTVGDPIEAIRRHFDRQSIRYDRNPFTRWVGRSELSVLRGMIPPAPQPGVTSALDFGCGTGRVTRLLLELGYSVTGYDLSPGMLAQARAALGHRPDVTFTADRQQIQAQWPLIVSLGVLDYYLDTAPLWQEWSELLASTGLLVVTAPNASSPLAWLYAATSRLTCPAFLATARGLMEKASSVGLIVTDVRGAFPGHPRLGHTLVLRLVPKADGLGVPE
jgi:SAM-dependent methyltransferase